MNLVRKAISAVFLLVLASGCGAYIGAGFGVAALSQSGSSGGGGSNPSEPQIQSVEFVSVPSRAGRPTDLSVVQVDVSVSDADGKNVSVELRVSAAPVNSNTVARVGALDLRRENVPTSAVARRESFTIDFASGGFSGLIDARIEAIVSDGSRSTRLESATRTIGNTPPVVSSVNVVRNSADGTASAGTVPIEFVLEDDSGDPVDVAIEYKLVAEPDAMYRPVEVQVGNVSGLEAGAPGSGVRQSVAWNSLALLGSPPGAQNPAGIPGGIGRANPGNPDLPAVLGRSETVVFRVTARNRIGGVDFGDAVGLPSTPVTTFIDNNERPAVIVDEPIANPDEDGPIRISFKLRDAEEDPADVVLQWSTDPNSFPDISDLRDEALRRRVLPDPDERAPRQILSPAPRVVTTGRIRVSAGRPANQIELTGRTPAVALDASRLVGRTLELLSRTNAIQQRRNIMSVDPAQNLITLDAAFNPPATQGRRARVREMTPEFTELSNTASAPGTTFAFTWNAPLDLGTNDHPIFVRATAFVGERQGAAFTASSTVGKRLRTNVVSYEASTLQTGVKPTSVTAADLDGDGNLDLISSDSSSNQLSVFIGNGDGSFQAPFPLQQVSFSRSVTAADVDGDGNLDLISPDGSSNQLSVFLGNGDGSFQAPSTLPTGNAPSSVKTADLNGDGNLDLISADRDSNQLSVFLGNGDGSFQAPSTLQTDGPRSVTAADLDGDGNLDLISADRDSNQLSVFLGNGDGSFQAPSTLQTDGPRSVTAVDLNGDGNLDLISAEDPFSLSSGQLSLFRGDGDGTFQALPPLQTGFAPQFVTAADLDGDGNLDLISADAFSNQLSVFRGNGDGSFQAPNILPTGDGPQSVTAADLNGDGNLDLISADSLSNQLSVFLYNGDGSFQAPSPPQAASPGSVTAADLDGDGKLDLISADFSSLSVFLGNGDGAFQALPPLQTGIALQFVTADDLDGDGNLDLISADFHSNQLSVFLGNGDGSFQAPSTLQTDGPRSVTAVDLNGDGNLDLISADLNSNQLSVFLGNGDGSFQAPSTLQTDGSEFVTAADLDRDGNLDLISVDSSSNQLSVFLGNGDGTVQTPSTLQTDGPRSVTAVDLNGDGNLDLISADSASNQLSVFRGNGDGTFQTRSTLQTGLAPQFVTAADLDGDENLDLISADPFSNQLSVFLGNGDGSFQAPFTLQSGDGPQSVTAADLNGDGLLDLISADLFSDQLSVFLGARRRLLPPGARIPMPTTGNALGGVLMLTARTQPYRINAGAGTIDGVQSPAYQGRSFRFSSITIDSGARVLVTGKAPLQLLATGDITINGELLVDGEGGQNGASSLLAAGNAGGAGGAGGPGADAGGAGGGSRPGAGRLRGFLGKGGGRGNGGAPSSTAPDSGGGGGFGTPGQDAGVSLGGPFYSNPALEIFLGGSGGGGGGARDVDGSGTLNSGDEGAGGGGGGGGAIRLTAGGTITVNGRISANGGPGRMGDGSAGNGGGGSGGAVLLQAYGQLAVGSGATITANGGPGGFNGTAPDGGAGGDGRIRLEDSDGQVITTGATVSPAADLGTLSDGRANTTVLTIASGSGAAGTTVNLDVTIEIPSAIMPINYQTDIRLPNELTVDPAMISRNATNPMAGAPLFNASDVTATASPPAGTTQLRVFYATFGAPVAITNGVLFTVPVQIPAGTPSGTYNITLLMETVGDANGSITTMTVPAVVSVD